VIPKLATVQEKANEFKKKYFASKMPFDPVLNTHRRETEDDVFQGSDENGSRGFRSIVGNPLPCVVEWMSAPYSTTSSPISLV
jgi:hypothetical protein